MAAVSIVAAGLTMLASACSSSASQREAASQSPPTRATPTRSSTPAPSVTSSAPSSGLTTAATIDYQSKGGYTWTVTVAFGPIVSVTDPSVDQALVNDCDANTATAGFIPMRITMTNTTSSFSEDTAASFRLYINQHGDDYPNNVQWAGEFNDGPQCDDSTTTEPFTVTHTQLAAGASSYTNGGLIVTNWKSPDYPDGNAAYANLWLGQANESDTFDVSVVWTASNVIGPNVVDSGSQQVSNLFSKWYIPVSQNG